MAQSHFSANAMTQDPAQSPAPRRVFITPQVPLPDCVAGWMAQAFGEKIKHPPADFLDTLFVVPAHRAGENVRAAFLQKLAQGGAAGALSLQFKTFEELFDWALAGAPALSHPAQWCAWVQTLADARKEDFPELFARRKPEPAEISDFVGQIEALQGALTENFHTIRTAAQALEASGFSDPLWTDLGALEDLFHERCRAFGQPSRAQALMLAARNPPAHPWKEIVLVGHAELSRVQSVFLSALANTCAGEPARLTTLVFADDSQKRLFDEWGVPTQKFCERELELDAADISVCADVRAQARRISELAAGYGRAARGALAIACEQEQSAPLLQDALHRDAALEARAAEGCTLALTAICSLLRRLELCLRQGTFLNVRDFLNEPCVFTFVEQRFDLPLRELQKALDHAQKDLLPANVSEACALLERGRVGESEQKAIEALQWARRILGELQTGDTLKALEHLLEQWCGAFERTGAFAEQERRACELARQTLREIARTRQRMEIVPVVKYLIQTLKAAPARPRDAHALVLENWMGVFWSRAPHVVLADMNEGTLPMALGGGAFLNDSLREHLGLRTAKLRHARDAHMLEALRRSRSGQGSACHLLCPQRSLKEDPLKPSRLLMQTAIDALPARIKLLFGTAAKEGRRPSFAAPWKLKARRVGLEKKTLSVTALKDYLNSPWQFYLKHVLKARIFEAQKAELDAAMLGTLYHGAWQAFFTDGPKDSTDVEKIAVFLTAEFQRLLRENFGEKPNAFVRLQSRGIEQRLAAAARVQADWRAQGWRITDVELPCELQLGGWTLRGKIDRVDERDGRRMLIDYKTFDSIDTNEAMRRHGHFAFRSKEDGTPPELLRWTDLQLPLYVCAYARECPVDKDLLSAAYFLTPREAAKSVIEPWETITHYLGSALERARDVLTQIEAGNFAPAGKPPYDDYEPVFGLDEEQLARLNLVEFSA